MPELTEGPGGPAGYARLVKHYALKAMPNWHESFVAVGSVRRESIGPDGSVLETYIPVYWPGDSDFDHLEFALKNDGTNLALLAEIFKVIDADGLATFIAAAPFGKYRRRLWYLYEWLTEKRLPLDDMTSGNYIDLLPPEEYFTAPRGRRVPGNASTTTFSDTGHSRLWCGGRPISRPSPRRTWASDVPR